MLYINSPRLIITFLIFFIASDIFAQSYLVKNTIVDDSLIALKLNELRNDIEEYDNTRYDFGEMIYAPDNKFKILTIHAEACGAYCHNFFQSYLYYNKTGITVEADIKMADLSKITDIINISSSDGTSEYLIFDKRHVRPRSIETGTEVSFSHLAFTKGKPEFKNIHSYSESGVLFKELNKFFYSSENLCLNGDEEDITKGIPPTLSYNPETMSITYEYALLDESFTYPCKYVTGIYKYTDGIFTNK